MSELRDVQSISAALELVEEWAAYAHRQDRTIVQMNEEIIDLKCALELAQARAWSVLPLPVPAPEMAEEADPFA